ncbi:hypothetical protein PAXRUDRAFT_36838 [Paxillus rubicundulus Ve08.2h10]|uniref:DUF6589 domain-containing protein n=1 Tax=Paxillus rubicundulus Ve08.2h10 TaxID=930991 RepID=A0A0D0DGK8_9AGAM|nr:hypothetical protein PAXRUDRAFT_36838 [Paxillus rubicundulus Ve08.2h10]
MRLEPSLHVTLPHGMSPLCTHFETCQHRSDPVLQHMECRKMPKCYQTKQYHLCTSTIDESSVTGNIAVIQDAYINQLKMMHDQLLNLAVPSINNQSTNACICDTNPFTRLQFLQLGFGLFHLCMNLIWALLHVHWGSIHKPGSLSYFFAILDYYHTLLVTLLQILRGIILDAWKVKCGYSSLATFAASKPTLSELISIAHKILKNHASLTYENPKIKGKESTTTASPNHAHHNLHILTRDLLYMLELVQACSDDDFGACSNNYCSEILCFIFNLKKLLYRNIMHDNMLVNLTGLEGHCMLIDLNIEHLIHFLKCFFTAKGVYASWDRLGDISATVDLFLHVKKQVGQALGIGYHGITHITPDTSACVNKIAHKVGKLRLHQYNPLREENEEFKPVVDAFYTGEQKLKSVTLSTFNRKVKNMIAGEGWEVEDDELPPA